MSKQNTPHLPPKPQLTLHVGVTGQQSTRLSAEENDYLKDCIALTLETIKTAFLAFAAKAKDQPIYNTESPKLRVLSSLTDSGARIAVASALEADHDLELQCPLPFKPGEYPSEFAVNHDSPEMFDELRAKASKILELEVESGKNDQAYSNADQLVLNHSDLILAIVDGIEDQASVGKPNIVEEALRIDLPVIWINPKVCGNVLFFDPRSKETQGVGLDDAVIINYLIYRLLPTNIPNPATCDPYLSHKQPSRNPVGGIYRAFFKLLSKEFLRKKDFDFIGKPYPQIAKEEWGDITKAESKFQFSESLGSHFIFADSLASYYADLYRGTFVSYFVLGALAVLLALFGGPFEGFSEEFKSESKGFAWFELFVIFIIYLLYFSGKHINSHYRWLDYRLLAERLRQAAFLLPIGIAPRWPLPPDNTQAKPSSEQQEDRSYAWIDYLTRAALRAEGLTSGKIDIAHRERYRQFLVKIIDNQIIYHDNNVDRNRNIVELLHGANFICLIIITLACAIHLGIDYLEVETAKAQMETATTIIATFFPALVASIAGILSQGEFKRISHRSHEMSTNLKRIKTRLEEAAPNPTLDFLVSQANQTNETMGQELSGWRVIFHVKPLELHI